jgi:hypothetical protein
MGRDGSQLQYTWRSGVDSSRSSCGAHDALSRVVHRVDLDRTAWSSSVVTTHGADPANMGVSGGLRHRTYEFSCALLLTVPALGPGGCVIDSCARAQCSHAR